MSQFFQKAKRLLINSFLPVIIGLFLVVAVIYAVWQEPRAVPPGDNVPAPLNVGPDPQSKEAGLILNTGGARTSLYLQGDAVTTTSGLIVEYGNVGIGEINPNYKLDIIGALRLQPSSVPSTAQGVIYFDSTDNKFKCSEDGASFVDCVGSYWDLTLGTYLRPTDPNYNVAIGTSAISSDKLHVEGMLRVTSHVFMENSALLGDASIDIGDASWINQTDGRFVVGSDLRVKGNAEVTGTLVATGNQAASNEVGGVNTNSGSNTELVSATITVPENGKILALFSSNMTSSGSSTNTVFVNFDGGALGPIPWPRVCGTAVGGNLSDRSATCSGSYVWTSVPAGTYTIKVMWQVGASGIFISARFARLDLIVIP